MASNDTPASSTPHPNLSRRELLQVGYSGLLGMTLPGLFGQRASAAPVATSHAGSAKSIIIVYLTGAASHIDTFDPKPDAPAEIRGEYRPIATRTPGLLVSEHLPRLAARSDKYAIVRSMSHRENNHLVATHHVLTGHSQPGAFFDKVASRDDWPSYAGAVNYLRPRTDGVPTGVNLPTFLMEGPLTWPGQHAGFLGPRYDPWQISRDPGAADFAVENLRPAPGIEVARLNERRGLLEQVDAQQRRLGQLAVSRRLSDQQQLAFSVLTSGKIARAFLMNQEPAAVRDRYGRHPFGQSLLLARRLVEAGVPIVQANMGHVQNWDTHGDNFGRLKRELLPALDRAVAALLDDLAATGLLDDTLVLMMGEFGRTPRISSVGGGSPGRDHWAPCFFSLWAGGGTQPRQIIGRSDRIGGYPVTNPFTPDDLGATVYHALGVDPGAEVHDRQDRPVRLNQGEVMRGIFSGA